MTHPLTIWVGVIATLGVFSYLYKNNTLYRLVQHAALGATIGYTIVLTWTQALWPNWAKPIVQALDGTSDWTGALWLLALAPGCLWYFQLSKKYFWLSTFITSFFVGVAAGYAFKATLILIMPQIGASFKNLDPISIPGGLSWDSFFGCLSNLVFLVAMFTTLLYFFFSINTSNRVLRVPARVGRISLMVCLGGMFGATVMTRMAYLLERLRFLYMDWLRDQIIAIFTG